MIKCFILITFCWLIWSASWYIGYRYATSHRDYRQYAPMKWSMVKKIYKVKPSRFTYGEYSYSEPIFWTSYMKVLWYNDTPIMLSFFGYQMLRIRFILYLIDKDKEGKKDALVEVLEIAQRDINELMEQAQEEQQQGKDMIAEILKEWRK